MTDVDNTQPTDYHNDQEPDQASYIDDNYEVSNCCGATIYENTDICSDCKEHCDVQEEDPEEPTPAQTNAWLLSGGW